MDHKQRAHALLSVSGSSRWMNCPPSARLEDSIPDKGSTVFADEGTLAHEIGETMLRATVEGWPTSKLDKALLALSRHELYYDGMEDEVAMYVDFCLDEYKSAHQRTKGSAQILIEQRIDLIEFIPEGFGSNDCVILADSTMYVIDLKFGRGVRVNAQDNSQLKLYAVGAYHANEMAYDIDTVVMVIVQPRLDHISIAEISVGELMDWADNEVRTSAQLAHEGKGEFKVGDHCKWCKAKPICRAYGEFAQEFAAREFEVDKTLSDTEILEIYGKLHLLTDYVSSMNEYVLSEALGGKQWPGYKLVEGRSVRRWSDEGKAIEVLTTQKGFTEDDILNKKLKGIGEIEKLVGKKEFPDLLDGAWAKPEGKPTLVPETDKRPVWSPATAADDFAD